MQCITNSYDYTNWFEKGDKEPADTDIVLKVDKKGKIADLPVMPPLAGGNKVREGKRLTILNLTKLFTRQSLLLTQIKAGNNSFKLKNEIRQIVNLFYLHSKITIKNYSNLINSL